MNKRGLGRGLGALLSSTPSAEEALIDVPLDQIEPNPNQPRKDLDFRSLEELATSIRTSGVIQPVVVRRHGASFQLIAGERRWRAARQAGLERIPAIVREATDAQSLELALVENLLREDLNPIEEAFSKIKTLLRTAAARTHEALVAAIWAALKAITPADAHGYFTHCGYPARTRRRPRARQAGPRQRRAA